MSEFMTGVETATNSMDRNDEKKDIVDPAPVVPSPFRSLIETRIRVWRSLRAPTVQQIEWCQFWEEYLRQRRDEE